ncbi:ribonucleoside-triphosphate reductase, adenosylcobalamin-dependent [Hyphomicrobium sp. ghe19]|uniref:ribonucleoside-triphosphate reductase, adenosylcobalamin-dependent n=1 Tax=Hyphomicrobium sp. ghe19 TaxID=2682968 RepID=UPI001366D864|nr:Adenosylcobalamin-dependent ribonucleoside-triphosphate reductase [Hyphomicrobium sp. ghe19]
MTASFRSQLLTRRTYSRKKDNGKHETWEEIVDRVIMHQNWLWYRALGRELNWTEMEELEELSHLMLDRKVLCSGRTLWLGGTNTAKTKEASQFNCSFLKVESVYDVVDAYWLLLQGCGVGFEPVTGTLSGFSKPVKVRSVRSYRTEGDLGYENNTAGYAGSTFVLEVGDSSKAWAKSAGKLLAMKTPVDEIVLDFRQIRKAGSGMSQYGWTSDGDLRIRPAFEAICGILNDRAGELLTRLDIMDILNHLGTTLSSRRAAEICMMPVEDDEALDFAQAKLKINEAGYYHRTQSNNSLVFWHKPSKLELTGLFHTMLSNGGSEPGFINGVEAKRRAPWFKGVNPCAEILLGNKSFCNLFEVDLKKFPEEDEDLYRAVYLAGRANYRQTCVNLRDGVLSDQWHETNEYLRLCGVGLTGIVAWLDRRQEFFDIEETPSEVLDGLRLNAQHGACLMAEDLGLPMPKAVTTVKPSGTLGKIMDTTEGLHRPIAKYIFNNVNFSKLDPIIPVLKEAGYHIFDNPYDANSALVRIPVAHEGVRFCSVGGLLVDTEPAVSQLDRYALLMRNYVDHNASITISYSPNEIPAIVEWLDRNWSTYVGVSFLLRQDVTKTAADLGYGYLPQEVVTEERWKEYVAGLKPVDLDADEGDDMVAGDECAGGACPVR